MVAEVYDARAEGKAIPGGRPGGWLVNYAGNCANPVRVKRNSDRGSMYVDYYVRCRACKPCLRARAGYWTHYAVERTKLTAEQGRRTWFGTLTLRLDEQFAIRDAAIQKWAEKQNTSFIPEWWDDPKCDERFRLVREVLVRECQLYFKRLRKAGHRFKYFLVFERHKSGLPHVHWLLHEEGEPIRKADLAKHWKLGFTKVKLVGGYDRKRRRKLTPEYVAYYVAKYLSKAYQARQIVSVRYADIGST